MGLTTPTATASEQTDDYGISIVNESTMRLELLNEEVSIENDEVGNILVKKGDYTEVLPTQAIDSNGNEVNLIYKSVDNGLIIELHNNKQSTQVTRFARSKWKCTLGVLGGYYSGAITGLGGWTWCRNCIPCYWKCSRSCRRNYYRCSGWNYVRCSF
ncbi:hypothetical protein [Lysinibacillus sp. 38-6]|uniref:hypothetical protein n=1 Tax=Lysinibacillus sp. 38-6 TaxID=3385991 RepID=UPI003908B8D3